MTPDLAGLIVGTLLTLMVLSYILGDNPFYRLALHILVGATVGYGTAVALTMLFQTVLPALGDPAARLSLIVPVVLGILLLFKGFPRWASWGNLSTALLVGIGAAVALSGALLGTIIPQTRAVGPVWNWLQGGWIGLLNGLLMAVGTACALLAFAFAVPRNPSLRRLWNGMVGLPGRLGRVFLMIAFGAAFATALTASLSVLVGRIYTVVEGLQRILAIWGL